MGRGLRVREAAWPPRRCRAATCRMRKKARPTVEIEAGKAGPASQSIPADWPRLAEAGRGWPWLAEATGRPALDLALAGRIKAGGRVGRCLWAAAFHIGRCVARGSCPKAAGPERPMQQPVVMGKVACVLFTATKP
eukprot:scaffold77762_cov48-Phaeocystis_antarctica.AAC.9